MPCQRVLLCVWVAQVHPVRVGADSVPSGAVSSQQLPLVFLACRPLFPAMAARSSADAAKYAEFRAWLRRLADANLITVHHPELLEGTMVSNMSDASKRSKPDSEATALDPFELLEIFGHTGVHSTDFTVVSEAVPGNSKQIAKAPSGPVKLPDGIRSLRDWGRTLCTLPKIKNDNLCYQEILENDAEHVKSYRVWVHDNAGTSRSSKVDDLANFLKASGWIPGADGTAYPGTKEVRRFKQ